MWDHLTKRKKLTLCSGKPWCKVVGRKCLNVASLEHSSASRNLPQVPLRFLGETIPRVRISLCDRRLVTCWKELSSTQGQLALKESSAGATCQKPSWRFGVPAANVKVSCCQTVKSDWEGRYGRRDRGQEEGGKKAGDNTEETITCAQDRPADANRRKTPGTLLSLPMQDGWLQSEICLGCSIHVLSTVFDGSESQN